MTAQSRKEIENDINNFDLMFIATIRAIFDSKYKEMLYLKDSSPNTTNFCEFVYNWLGNF